ncbi:unnamed protein product [Ilex paraguariensis]
MDPDIIHDTSAPGEDANADEPEVELNNIATLEKTSYSGDILQELENAGEVLTRAELDLACLSEKLLNLNILMMHVATKESDFEAFVMDKEHIYSDSAEKALEFDLLSGILDSEVEELDDFMSTLQTDVVTSREVISSFEHLGEVVEEKLHDSEESLKQSLEQLSELKLQSANFQKILSTFDADENRKDDGVEFQENDEFSNLNVKIKMQTAEQQRHILRMLEKSLARELDFEKKVTESRQIEEDLRLRLHSSEQEVFFLEEEAAVICTRLFEADNAAGVLMGISKELLGRLQILQFNLNSSNQREGELRSKLQDISEQLKAKDSTLQKLESSGEKLINDLAIVAEDLKERISKAESRAENAEAKCKLLAETNMELNEESNLLKSTSDKVDSLERQLRESDIQLQHAVASAEASQEKQIMLYSTIEDMENLIEGLKSKVSKAESRADSAEDKCIILSEANSDLNEELGFLRGRMECLEASLHQAEETKKETAKDIRIRTKLITDLVMQLTLERERLHKQIHSLRKENKTLVKCLQKTNKDPSGTRSHDSRGNSKALWLSKHDFTSVICMEERKEATEFSATSFEEEKTPVNVSVRETEMGVADSSSKLEIVRNIDAWQLNFKLVFITVLMLLVSVVALFLFQHPTYGF